jgi:hypothetical protein
MQNMALNSTLDLTICYRFTPATICRTSVCPAEIVQQQGDGSGSSVFKSFMWLLDIIATVGSPVSLSFIPGSNASILYSEFS